MAQISTQRSLVALASATSANGTARNGASLILPVVQRNTLSVECTVTIVTGSVVCTINPQVSMDGTNWFDLKLTNNAANVTLSASGTVAIGIPAVSGWQFFRVRMTLSGAATAAGDLTAATYRYEKFTAVA